MADFDQQPERLQGHQKEDVPRFHGMVFQVLTMMDEDSAMASAYEVFDLAWGLIDLRREFESIAEDREERMKGYRILGVERYPSRWRNRVYQQDVNQTIDTQNSNLMHRNLMNRLRREGKAEQWHDSVQLLAKEMYQNEREGRDSLLALVYLHYGKDPLTKQERINKILEYHVASQSEDEDSHTMEYNIDHSESLIEAQTPGQCPTVCMTLDLSADQASNNGEPPNDLDCLSGDDERDPETFVGVVTFLPHHQVDERPGPTFSDSARRPEPPEQDLKSQAKKMKTGKPWPPCGVEYLILHTYGILDSSPEELNMWRDRIRADIRREKLHVGNLDLWFRSVKPEFYPARRPASKAPTDRTDCVSMRVAPDTPATRRGMRQSMEWRAIPPELYIANYQDWCFMQIFTMDERQMRYNFAHRQRLHCYTRDRMPNLDSALQWSNVPR